MNNKDRIAAFAQDIYVARHNQKNDVTGPDLDDFLNQTIIFTNQFIPEVEKEADWNALRTNDDTSIGQIINGNTIAYALPDDIRKLVVNSKRDLTIRQDGTVISSFKLVNPNQIGDPNDHDYRPRAMVQRRRIHFSRPLNENEVGGTIVADTIGRFPKLSFEDTELLDILDEYDDLRQLFILGITKNQILSDIVQGGLAPAFTTKYNGFLQLCKDENNASADADDTDTESFSWVGMVQ